MLVRHDLRTPGASIEAGHNPTYPTFLVGDVVVKFFGFVPTWQMTHAAERAALTLLLQDPRIRAPRLLATGALTDDVHAPWPYLVTARLEGGRLDPHALTATQHASLIEDLAEQLRRVHTLPPSASLRAVGWAPVALTEALARSSLPPHLAEQAPDFVAGVPRAPKRFLHGDVVEQHVFVRGGRLMGLIDWGDAVVADPHLELAQLYRATFACDAARFHAFLDAYGWVRDETLPRRLLGHALERQALGLAQHLGMDVFEPMAQRFDLARVPTLDALAARLVEV